MKALFVLAAVAVAARWQTFGNPVLGFDEQFYLLVGERMWHGAVPYVDIFDRKPIGLFLVYALAAMPGADGFVVYKVLALISVVATALILYGMARRVTTDHAALLGAALYVLWLDFMEGDGGQSPVLYNLPMAAAAAVLLKIQDEPGSLRRRGVLAMVLVGIALQIKYSVVVEGVWFGLWLIACSLRQGKRWQAVATSMLLWVGAALVPTLLALTWYVAIGQGRTFIFANFLSVMGQGQPSTGQLKGALLISAMLAPLAIAAAVRFRTVPLPERGFLGMWLGAAVSSVVLYGRFASPHYAMPILLPLVVLAAPAFAVARRRAAGLILAGLAFVGGQGVLAASAWTKGGAAQAAAVASAARVERGCLYVYDGYPALYLLTHSCLPTRWVFPGHLETADEANPAALGVDPVDEVRRIMASRPEAIVDDYPSFAGGNPATRRVLQEALDRDYVLSACVPTGPGRVRLVYRRRGDGIPNPAGCPPRRALRQ